MLSRDLRQRRIECGGSAGQILERADVPRLLRVLFRDPRPDFGESLAALDHLSRRADVEFMVLDRRVLWRPDAEHHYAVAAAVRNIAIAGDRPVPLMPAEFCKTLGIMKLVRSKSLHVSCLRVRRLLGS